MKKIIYKRADGRICVVHPAPKERVCIFIPEVAEMTDDQFIEFIKDRDIPQGATEISIIDESELPKDRENRELWEIKEGKIHIDPVKVQEKESKKAEK